MDESINMIPAADLPSEASENCDHIAYQFSGVIQPHGVLVIINPDDFRILQISENASLFFGMQTEVLLGQHLFNGRILSSTPEVINQFNQCISDAPRLISGLTTPGGLALLGRVTRTDGRFHLELEFATSPYDVERCSPIEMISEITEVLSRTESVKDIAESFPQVFRKFIGYDRCMVYRFDPEFNGEVIGESRSENAQDTFLGLRFPMSDIPKSARKMFADSPVRVTVDQTVECVPITPRRDPETQQDVDLTAVRIRGAAGSCQTYYNNMGVRSTLVMPIFYEHELWGLVSCHHGQPRRPSPELDSALKVVVKLISNALEHAAGAEHRLAERKARSINELLAKIDPFASDCLVQIQQQVENLKEMIDCTGFLLRIDEQDYAHGEIPDDKELQTFIESLLPMAGEEAFAINNIPEHFPALAELRNVAAGGLLVPLRSNPNEFAVWFRAEQPLTVNWAGDPQSGLKWNQQGRPELTPRNSFELWKSKTANTCYPWSTAEIAFANSVSTQIGLISLSWHALRADRAKSEFLTNMSHEIRTPMTSILGYLDILESEDFEPEDPMRLEAFSVIKRSGNHLMQLINDILDLSSIESGRINIEKTEIELESLVEEALTMVRDQADHKQLELSLKYESMPPHKILTDPTRVKQILLNLLENAIKFTEQGGVSLKIFYRNDDQSTKYVYLQIIDSGIGMDQDQLDIVRSFKTFNQLDNSLTRKYGGTGLGLRISHGLSQKLGGRIEVESQKEMGSIFTLCLPVEEPAKSVAPKSSSIGGTTKAETHELASTSESLTGTRILLAEDDLINQKVIASFLTISGAEVTVVSDGKLAVEAVLKAESAFFDLILMDMQMPVLDGYSATSQLRNQGYEHPVIALTAHAMEGSREKCIAAGCDDFMTKPVNRKSLINICKKWIDD